MGVKQTQAQTYLNNLSIQGQTKKGKTQELKTQVIDQNKKNLSEFLLIKHKPEGGVEIKGQFINDKKPTEKEKLLFLIGEACYAAAFNINALRPEEVATSEQKKELFENFMKSLTSTVKNYHKLDK
ncbi:MULTISPECIES: hypothetical protein [Lactococcus]|uniref:Uncharacterized protein n=1 Tax=Lactococcus formosensis TaxID=1281486 RepID=A0A9X4SM94_9LACT|nr:MULTISPECIES: hypothetical protein [Lactococcus]PST74038.1 hypothetical protein AEH57_01750 [Lactococcus garvieae]MDG6112236.1 hypothetical protein [Lactococcus formosensis]MDG6114487.1 hypothetical protein [Lactococcus formosensis]MDG6116632.1 hypothetical protein [Lactococcus formosensis]MDG6118417.1 hypothetical protein [Lactococcus formosensis]